MRRKLYLLAGMALWILPTVATLGQPAAVDLSMRRAVYFTGTETQKINRTGTYVAENGTLTLNQIGRDSLRAHGHPRMLFTSEELTGADLQFNCPASVVSGIISAPAGWLDISKRANYFTNLSIQHTVDGSQVSCEYGGSIAISRVVAGRVCQRTHPDSLVVVCRAIPTKK